MHVTNQCCRDRSPQNPNVGKRVRDALLLNPSTTPRELVSRVTDPFWMRSCRGIGFQPVCEKLVVIQRHDERKFQSIHNRPVFD